MINLYLDGCSFTYGLGLSKHETLSHHFTKVGYNVINLARSGKSNIAIANDVYLNHNKSDIFVLGFTFSHRYHFKFHEYDIDILPSGVSWQMDDEIHQGNQINDILVNLQKNFYLLYDSTYWSKVSDMLIDNTIDSLKNKNKKVFVFSWEKRNTNNKLFYPVISDRLPDGHLNSIGTKKLFDLIQNNLGNP